MADPFGHLLKLGHADLVLVLERFVLRLLLGHLLCASCNLGLGACADHRHTRGQRWRERHGTFLR